MTTVELVRSLRILRAQTELVSSGLAALEASIEEMRPQPPPPDEIDGKCQHPEGSVIPAATMGNPGRRYCGRCRTFLTNEGD